MDIFQLTLLLALVVASSQEDLECNTAEGWFRLGCSKCYKVFKGNDDRSWVRAREICQRYGSQLVTIQDQTENDALGEEVEKQAGNNTHYWIGLSKYEDDSACTICNELKWSTGVRASDADGFWSNGQPDSRVGECVYSRRMQNMRYTYDRPFTWSYGQCNSVMTFVCEREAHPSDHFPCFGGGYVRKSLTCDGVQDCPDGSDEINCPSRCSFYQKGTSGDLTRFSYENAKTCTWAIETPLGTNARIELNGLDTEQQADFVTVFVGNIIEKKASRVARLSGSHGTKQYRSHNNMIFIKFTSDARVTARGFTGTYSSESTGLPGYKKDFTAKDVTQTYLQTGFNVAGIQSFVGMTDYIYLIKTEQLLHQIITVNIVTMDIHDSDKIIFYDGDKPTDAVLATMCNKGCTNYPVVFSTGTSMSIFFKTEMEISKSVKFEFSYRQGCNFESSASWGTLFTPGYPGNINYPDNTRCTWTLNANEPITLYFDDDLALVDTDHGRQNNADYLEIFDSGNAMHSANRGFTSNELKGQLVKATTGKVRLNFNTSPTRSARGFMATWSKACPDPKYDAFTTLSAATLNNFYKGKTTLNCASGYGFHQGQIVSPQLSVELECGFKGIWEKYLQIPRCTPVYCGDAPQISNGFIVYSSGSTFNSVTQYQCFQGSTLNPSNGENITCAANGNWGTPPTCQAASCQFGLLTPLTFARGSGTLQYNDGTKIASIVKYTCEDGFEIDGEPYSFCQANGTWTKQKPTCKPKTCILPEIANGDYNGATKAGGFINYESRAFVSCRSGYQLKNNTISSVTCNVDRSLTELPQCVDTDECTTTTPCSHGCVNTVPDYYCTCPDGYNISTTNKNLCEDIHECNVNNPCDKRGTCSNKVPGYTCFCNQPYVLFAADGTSGYKIPQNENGLVPTDTYYINHTCVLIQCPAVANVVNGKVLTKRENHHYGDFVEVQCDLGFQPRRTVLSCGTNGQWSPSIPTCSAAKCPNDPNPSFNNNAKYDLGPYDYKKQLSLQCSTPAQNFTWYRHCTYNSATDVYQMQGSIYNCGEIDCGSPIKYSGTTYDPSSMITKFGSQFGFVCSSGNVAAGSSADGDSTVRCKADGLWDFGNLQCQTYTWPARHDYSCLFVTSVDSDPTPHQIRVRTVRYSSVFLNIEGNKMLEIPSPNTTNVAYAISVDPDQTTRNSQFDQALACKDPGYPVGGSLTAGSNGLVDGSKVTYDCTRPGYSLSGNKERTCNRDTWTGNMATCIDTEKPSFASTSQCGGRTKAKMFELVKKSLPTVLPQDNTGVKEFTIDPSNANTTMYMLVAASTSITFRATDYATNTNSCIFTIDLQDETPPDITCPSRKDIFISTDSDDISHSFIESQFIITDKSTTTFNLVNSIPTSFKPSDLYNTFTVEATATDQENNKGTCKVQVFVQPLPCSEMSLPTPVNSVKSCSVGSGGVVRSCTVTCNDQYTFRDSGNPSKLKTFSCTGGTWSPAFVSGCIKDVTNPYASCPAAGTIILSGANSFQEVDFKTLQSQVTTQDLNTISSITFSPESYNFTGANMYQNVEIAATVTDLAGRTTTCKFNYIAKPEPCSPLALAQPQNAEPNQCNAAGSGFSCTIKCNEGYVLFGSGRTKTVTCSGTGVAWNEADMYPACVRDAILPTITCPSSNVLTLNNPADNHYLDFTQANNAGYSVNRNDNGEVKSVEYFPKTLNLTVVNLDASPASVTVKVTDTANNEASCVFYLTVAAVPCSPLSLEDPLNGKKVCTRAAGNNGWSCVFSCDANYVFGSTTATTITTACTDGSPFPTRVSGCISQTQTKSKEFKGTMRIKYIPTTSTITTVPDSCRSKYEEKQKISVIPRMAAKLKSVCDVQTGILSKFSNFDVSFLLAELSSSVSMDLTGQNRIVTIEYVYTMQFADADHYRTCSDNYESFLKNAGNAYSLKENIIGDGQTCPDLHVSETVSQSTTQPLTGFYCLKPYFPSPTDANLCIPCPAGTQSDTFSCNLCAIGKYRSEATDGDCASCQTNQITKFEGSTSSGKCIGKCSAGFYSATGYSPCMRCPVGSYADGIGKTQCTSCTPPETTVITGSVSESQCFNKTTTIVNAADCPLGTEKRDNTCKLCVEGTYRSQSNQVACQSCSNGFTTFIKGAVSVTSCKAGCAAGHTSSNGQAPCTQCLKGSYAANSTTCLSCAVGFSTRTDGSTSSSLCEPMSALEVNCPPGSIKKGSSCELCPIGTYRSVESLGTNDACLSCNSGFSTYFAGATSSSQCKVKCQIGFFSASGLSPCQPCGTGKYWVNSTNCLQCPNGGTTATTTSTQCIDKCKKGQFSYSGFNNLGFNNLGTACRACPVNYYQDEEGQKTCKPCGANQYSTSPGLTASSQCQDANLQCSASSCSNRGVCSIQNRAPLCTCQRGYYGSKCETTVNYCLSNPCYNGAQCTFNTTGYYCTCRNQYTTGKDCSDIVTSCVTDLTNPTCKHGGHCLNTPDGKKCLCAGGFTGDTCSDKSNICTTQPCAAGKFKNCVDTSKGENLRRKCICQDGYTGVDCADDIDECASNPCVNNGQCKNGVNVFTCDCPTGYFGTYCEKRVPLCGDGTCGSNAICVDDHKEHTYRCICNPGYAFGTYRKFIFHPDKAAKNVGSLSSSTRTVDQCRDDCVADPSCYGFSYAYNDQKCYFWTNTILDTMLFDNVGYNTYVISRKEQPDDDFWSDLFDLSKPTNAQEESLQKVIDAGLHVCYRTTPLASECCEVGKPDSCSSTDSQHRCFGSTVNLAIRFKCSAARVFQKNSCSRKNYCDGNPCAPGSCRLSGSSYTCTCGTGYSGRHCNINTDDCIGHQCQNGGECIDQLGRYDCKCKEGFEGSRCTNAKNYCSAGFSTCSFHGQCVSEATDFLCRCNTGYEGKTCADEVDYCKSNPCLQGGVCTKRFGGYTCRCMDGWEGTNCDKPVDNCLVPATGRNCQGTCHNIFNDYYCQCSANKYDKNCASGTDPCVQYNKCLNSGACNMVNSTMTCSCPPKYMGDGCQTLIDHCGKTNNCKNGATCEVTATGYKCNCQSGYEGTNCDKEKDECQGVTCPGAGQCFDGIDKYYCRCPLKFTGTNCAREYDKYYDLYFNNPYGFAWIPYFIKVQNMKALAFSMWVRFAEANGQGIYFTQFTGNKLPEAKKWLEFTDTGVNIYYGGSNPVSIDYIRTAVINDGNWNLVNFNYDLEKGEATLYLNTVLQKTVADINLKMTMATMDMWTVLGCQFNPAKETCTGTKSFHGYLSQLNAYTRFLSFNSATSAQGDIPFLYENPQHVFDTGNLLVWNEYLLETGVSRIIPTEAFGTSCSTPGRNPSCSFYSALTRPSVTDCPKSFTVYSSTRVLTTSWSDPKFHNLGSTGTVTPPKYQSGGLLNWGDFCITYIARDGNGNKAYCSFKVYVRSAQCERDANHPLILNQQCIPSTLLSRQGCTVSCNNPSQYVIDRVQPKVYTCGPSGTFNSKNAFQKWRYPSCGAIQPQPKVRVEIRLEYKISTTACSAVKTNILVRIREEFVKMAGFFVGTLCGKSDCTDVDIKITCGTARRRRAVTSAITVVDIIIPSADASTTFDGETRTIQEFLTYFALGADVFDFSDTIPDGNMEKDKFYIKVVPVCPDKQVLVAGNCVKCGPGNYFRYTDATNTTGICDDCPLGQYQTLPDQEQCVACGTQLTTEMSGTFKSDGCKKSCPVGKFFNDTANDCSPCDIGYYQDEVGQFYCKFCGAGFTTDDYGATSVSKCSETCNSGFQLDSSGDCKACAIGQYRNAKESRTCQPCTAGFITKNNASVSSADCTVRACNPGTKLVVADNKCENCEIGTYQTEKWQTTCTPCGDGNMSRWRTDTTGSDSPTKCRFYCPSGFEVTDPAKTTCTICKVGFYKDNTEDFQGSCRLCEGNKRTEKEGATSKSECTIFKCLKGHKANAANTDCEKCPLGTYQDVLHSTFCKNCTGDKTSTREEASEKASDCEEYCDSGYQMTSTGCVKCTMGYYKDNNLGLFTNCTKCPLYFTTAGDGTALKSDCKIPTCDPGNKRNAADTGCEECPLGTYQPLPYQQTCEQCTPGTSTRQINSTAQTQCEAYCASGSEKIGTQCTKCTRGYYKDNSDGLFSACVMCPTDKITAGLEAKSIAECDIGNCTAGQKLNGKVCEDCPKGSYQSQKWQTQCLLCGKDKTTENPKADNEALCILKCQPGFEDISGACKPCSVGYYKVEEAAAKCKLCQSDTITEGVGSISPDNCTLPACKPGHYLDRSAQPACMKCPYDQFQTEQWQEKCDQCAGGTVTLMMGADKPSLCVENCTSGNQFISGQGCSVCPIGYYRNQGDRSQATCQMCDAKFITPTTGATAVTECNIVNCTTPGWYRHENNTCQKCPYGTYGSEKWLTKCKACQTGFTTLNEGSTLASDCRPSCPEGRYVGAVNQCELCPVGTYKSTTQDVPCTNCSGGFITAGKGSTAASQCNVGPCGVGQKFITTTQICMKCEKGSYQNEAGKTDCKQCPHSVKYTPREGAVAVTECDSPCTIGQFLNVTTEKCEACPVATFQDEANTFVCKNCPAQRKYTSSTGKISINDCVSFCSTTGANSCSNNGTCIDNDTGYTCACKLHYEDYGTPAGTQCMHKCDRGYCKNNAECVADPAPVCKCTEWYEGATCNSRKNAETLADTTLDIIIPVAISAGALLLFLIILAVCCVFYMHRKKADKPPTRFSEYPQERVDKASLQSYDYGQRPFNGAGPQRLMLAPYSEMVYDNPGFNRPDSAVYEA